MQLSRKLSIPEIFLKLDLSLLQVGQQTTQSSAKSMQLSLIQRLRGSRDAQRTRSSSSSSSHAIAAIHHHASHPTTTSTTSSPHSSKAATTAVRGGVGSGTGRESSGRLSYEARPFYPHGEGGSNDHLSHHQQQLGERLFPRVQSLRFDTSVSLS